MTAPSTDGAALRRAGVQLHAVLGDVDANLAAALVSSFSARLNATTWAGCDTTKSASAIGVPTSRVMSSI